jgi:uncharacterized protein (DUF2147 family)
VTTASARRPAVERRRGPPGSAGYRRRLAPIVVAVGLVVAPTALSPPGVPEGVWLMDGRVAVQIFACDSLMCGRVIWLLVPRDPEGLLDRDKNNPDPALRSRKLCGLTILRGLRPDGANRWKDGTFYNPDDGKTYRVTAEIKSADAMIARIYVGLPIFGRTKTLSRVTHDVTEGWC